MNELKCVTRDPACGMIVDETTALRTDRDGRMFYFCSATCRKTFLSAPNGEKVKEGSGRHWGCDPVAGEKGPGITATD